VTFADADEVASVHSTQMAADEVEEEPATSLKPATPTETRSSAKVLESIRSRCLSSDSNGTSYPTIMECSEQPLEVSTEKLAFLSTGNIPFVSLESGGYSFTEDIAKTNQGKISLAADAVTGSLCCVKCYDKPMLSETLELLISEASLLFDLGKHPNIGGALNIFQDPISYYLVQPYYRGGNLVGLKKRAVGEGVCPTEVWWSSIFCQCLEGLAHMHSQGVMHCDIKEPNIMLLNEDLQEPGVVIIDLGVAQLAQTERAIIYGTPGYIPPEVWDAKNWLPQSDMFSLGVVVVQMLLGKTGIFTEGTRTHREVMKATSVRNPPLELMPLEFPHFRWLGEKLLAKDFLARPTAASLLVEPWGEKIEPIAESDSALRRAFGRYHHSKSQGWLEDGDEDLTSNAKDDSVSAQAPPGEASSNSSLNDEDDSIKHKSSYAKTLSRLHHHGDVLSKHTEVERNGLVSPRLGGRDHRIGPLQSRHVVGRVQPASQKCLASRVVCGARAAPQMCSATASWVPRAMSVRRCSTFIR
jgi:serine/threonine protein kinase